VDGNRSDMTIYWASVFAASVVLLGIAAFAGKPSPETENAGLPAIVVTLCSGVRALHLHVFAIPGAILGIGTSLNTPDLRAAARWIMGGMAVILLAPFVLLMWQTHLMIAPGLAATPMSTADGTGLPGGYGAEAFSVIGYVLGMTISLLVSFLYMATPLGLVAASLLVCIQFVLDRLEGTPWPWQAQTTNSGEWLYEIGAGAILVVVTFFVVSRSLVTSQDAQHPADTRPADVMESPPEPAHGVPPR